MQCRTNAHSVFFRYFSVRNYVFTMVVIRKTFFIWFYGKWFVYKIIFYRNEIKILFTELWFRFFFGICMVESWIQNFETTVIKIQEILWENMVNYIWTKTNLCLNYYSLLFSAIFIIREENLPLNANVFLPNVCQLRSPLVTFLSKL